MEHCLILLLGRVFQFHVRMILTIYFGENCWIFHRQHNPFKREMGRAYISGDFFCDVRTKIERPHKEH